MNETATPDSGTRATPAGGRPSRRRSRRQPAVENSIGQARATEPASQAEVRDAADKLSRTSAASGPSSAGTGKASGSDVPEAVRARFLQVGREYFFADGAEAFQDHGTRLTTRSENTELIRSLVTIAQARGWQVVQVAGTARFRQLAWQAGLQVGLEVRGYRASSAQKAKEARNSEKPSRRDSSTAERASQSEAAPAEESRRTQDPRRGVPPVIRGELLEHGRASYLFHPQEQSSYFIKLRTPEGERTVWGADLERALRESTTRPQLGDVIGVQPSGREPVTISAPIRDADGQISGRESKAAHRNRWTVDRLEVFENRQGAAQTFQDAQVSPTTGVERHPELKDAYLHVRAAQAFAEERIATEVDRRRFVQLVRGALAVAVARGDAIPPARLHERQARREARVHRPQEFDLAR